jgi:branched-chain amino acid transport system permease protein
VAEAILRGPSLGDRLAGRNRHIALAAAGLGAVAIVQLGLKAPTPIGIVLLGVVLGSLNGLLGIGIVLVHRTNRIVNFAHGSMGGLAAVVFVELVFRGVPYFVALILGLLLAGVIGALLEVLVMRRFAQSPRLLATVATIGIDQVVGAISLALPFLLGRQVSSINFRTPLSRFRFRVDPVAFDGNHVLIVVVVVLVSIGLGVFFRTRFGLAVRAASENPDRAALSGIPIAALTTAVWAIAAMLSASAAVLQAPVVGFRTGFLVGPGLLVQGLAAAVVGRMTSLKVTALTAIGLGVFGQAAFWELGNANIVPVLSLVVLLVALVVSPPKLGRLEAAGTFQSVAPVRPLAAAIARVPAVRVLNVSLAMAVGLALVVVPVFLPDTRRSLLTLVAIYGLVGLSLVVLTGWAGQISLGQFAFVGLGAAVSGSLTSRAHLDFTVGLAGGVLAGVAAAVALGLPALRVRGLYLAVTTLAFAVATSSYVLGLGWLAPVGLVDRPVLFGRFDLHSELAYYWVCLAAVGVVVLVLRLFRASQVWRTIVAVRDNERAAQAYAVNPVVAKLTAFALSGAIAGLAGGLLVHAQYRMQESQYDAGQSLTALTMAVIGGLGSVPGALIGAAYVKGVQYFLPGYGALLSTGVGLVLLLLILPRGLGAVVFELRDRLAARLARRSGS